jgi:hypothetical protein
MAKANQGEHPDPEHLDWYIDRLHEHLQTTARPEDRAMWEDAVHDQRRATFPWRYLRFIGIKPRKRHLPPMEPKQGQPKEPLPVQHPVGYPIEGFFLATGVEISDQLVENGPGPAFSGVEVKNQTPVEVANLGEILGAGTYDALFESMWATMRGGESEECGLFQVAPEIRDPLATLTDVNGVAARWAATEELQADGWTDEIADEVVSDLVRLAQQARQENKNIWVWWSL